MTTEVLIQSDVDALRTHISDTQALYREVCAVLFFRYGITPTANKLYQYVRKGSMSAPATALSKFWEDLREKSRVRIEHPDLPEGIRVAAGELVSNLWTQAQAAAQEGLDAFRADAQTKVLEAQAKQADAERQAIDANGALVATQEMARAATDRALALGQELAAALAAKMALSQQLEVAAQQQTAMEAALAEARREFTGELDKLRLALQRTEERSDAADKRALLEIDRERTIAAKLQKDLGELRKDQARWQSDASEARVHCRLVDQELQEARASNQRQAEQIAQLKHELGASHSRATMLEQEIQRLRATRNEVRMRRGPKRGMRET